MTYLFISFYIIYQHKEHGSISVINLIQGATIIIIKVHHSFYNVTIFYNIMLYSHTFSYVSRFHNTAWVRAQHCKLQKGCTRLATASDTVYQLLAQGRWFSPTYTKLNTNTNNLLEKERHTPDKVK
jgi:hypothetical protein